MNKITPLLGRLFAALVLVSSVGLPGAELGQPDPARLEPDYPAAGILIVADEFPAMEILAKRLKAEENKTSQIVDQAHLPGELARFDAVVVYIHRGLAETTERALIEYTEAGGRLIVLHHSISSGKRKNRHWFGFLGVELPGGDVEQGGYKWTEGVTVEWVNVAGDHYVMTNRLQYSAEIPYSTAQTRTESRPAFTLHDTEVYLNHVLHGPRTVLMGLRYTDAATGKTWMQSTAGWVRPAGKGRVVYLMPGHSIHDFENAVYGRIVINAIAAPLAALN